MFHILFCFLDAECAGSNLIHWLFTTKPVLKVELPISSPVAVLTAISILQETWRNADPLRPTHQLSDPPIWFLSLSPYSSTNIPLTCTKWCCGFSLTSSPNYVLPVSSVGSHSKSSHGTCTWVAQVLLEPLCAQFRETCRWYTHQMSLLMI